MIEQRIGTFAELYPDGEQASELHYAFAHQFLPWYVWTNASPVFRLTHDTTEEDVSQFVRARWGVHFLQMAGLRGPFDTADMVSDLRARRILVGHRDAILVTMPEPPRVTRAFFVLLVAMVSPEQMATSDDPTDLVAQVRAFTLERSAAQGEDGPPRMRAPAVLGEWSGPGQHSNHGQLRAATADEFVAAVAAMLERGGAQTIASTESE